MSGRQTKVDWFRVIVDLERAGYSFTAISTVTGVARSTIIGWKQGAAPRWEDGECLLDLWMTVTKNGRDGFPVISRYDYRA